MVIPAFFFLVCAEKLVKIPLGKKGKLEISGNYV